MSGCCRFAVNAVVQNAFSDKLYPLGFNLFVMLVVDLLHEFELGIWKAVFTHLLRMLESEDKSKIHELDHRSEISCPAHFILLFTHAHV